MSQYFQRFGAILLIMVTFVVYAPALRNGFVWDDTALVLRDPLIRSWRLIPEGFRHFLFVDATGSNFYRPLQRLTFTVDYAAWGFGNAWGWHLTSIATHAAAAVALFAFLRRWLGQERWRWALGIAVVWAIHPVHTSAVTYIAGRADPLAALFGFTGLWLALKRDTRAQFYAGLCFLGALLSKESGSVFLLMWLMHLIGQRQPLRALLYAILVLAVYLPLRLTAQKTPPPPSETPALIARPILAARAIAEYAGLLIAPVNLRMERDVATRPAATPEQSRKNARLREWQTLLGAMLIGGFAIWYRRGRRETREALLFAAIAYVPISNIMPLNATVAEHWIYVPSAFLLAAFATTAQASRWIGRMAASVMILWALFLATRTWMRQADWHDQRTFLTRTIAAGGDSARMRVNLGNLEASEGHTDRALAEYREALRRNPELSFAHFAIAATELKRGRLQEARAALERSAEAPGLAAEKVQLLATLDFAEKKVDPVPGYLAAANSAPLQWPLRRRYLMALAQSGRRREAATELRRFLETQDFRADSWLLLVELMPPVAEVARIEARRRDVRLP